MPCCKVADSWKVKGAVEKQRALRVWRPATAVCVKGAPCFVLCLPGFMKKKKEKRVCCKHRELYHCEEGSPRGSK